MGYEQRFARVLACVVGAAWLAHAPVAHADDTYEWCRIHVESTTPSQAADGDSPDETRERRATSHAAQASHQSGSAPTTLWFDVWRQLVSWWVSLL
jgi:hypothetical protein